MIVVSNRLQVAKGHEKEFEERFEGIVLTHWQDEASFHAWTESAEFKEAHRNRPRAEIFAGPNVFEMHEIIQHAEKS